ncbi:helix-turn-helix transcriptional regulator [Actinoplanes sp. NEAU-A12]|uniref:Helix-turn-helix transcriptional regulator n=1 Tax=Actinoplanes sandaracinus TaxID=3045177 RepID=A0ABT6WQG1_9ACTN|nr:helix-turn-helix transcriptional regulator [Actinoplanes sandaracinus]MDI6101924.1 helix-turn-helix transcriptional regulator [Actinoplanes sandaracinus]
MSDIEGPTLRRRRLGAELKRCREAAGLTQQDVSRHFEWHSAKVTRIETARVAVTPRDVRDLLTLYNVRDQGYREAMVELARMSRERTWWTDYRDIMRPGNFVGLEAAASAVRAWEPVILPGLLQTPAYMRSLMRSGRPLDPEEHIDRRIALRLMRQGRLTGERPLEMSAFIDEAVVRRVIGGEEVMAEQLRHLIDIAKLPNVFLQILPFNAGEHMFLSGPATLLEFRETTHMDVVYMEGLAGDLYEEQPDMVDWYRQEFERLSAKALDHRETIKMIESLLVA